jgi:transcriptional antiterminator NusG
LHRWCDIIQDGDFLKLDFEEAEYEGAEASSPERKWYVVHTYSGYENKVKANLEKRVESMNMEHQIFNVIIPEEDEIEYKGGQRKVTKRRIFPGYVMVDMILSDDSWMTVRHTPGVIGFVGSGTKPIPLQKQEVDKILRHMGLIGGKPKIDVQVGQHVRVKSGPFENFEGVVREVLAERGKIRVNISMFGRETPIELEYEQIDKI